MGDREAIFSPGDNIYVLFVEDDQKEVATMKKEAMRQNHVEVLAAWTKMIDVINQQTFRLIILIIYQVS